MASANRNSLAPWRKVRLSLNQLSLNQLSLHQLSLHQLSLNRHSTNRHSTNRHSTNCHSTNRHSTNRHSTNRHSTNCHSTNCHSTNRHSTVTQPTVTQPTVTQPTVTQPTVTQPTVTKLTLARRFVKNLIKNAKNGLVAETRSKIDGRTRSSHKVFLFYLVKNTNRRMGMLQHNWPPPTSISFSLYSSNFWRRSTQMRVFNVKCVGCYWRRAKPITAMVWIPSLCGADERQSDYGVK